MFIQRIWEASDAAEPLILWDAGNEFWEMKNNTIRHFSLISRVKDEMNEKNITEMVQLLNESPIPLEVIRHEVRGWEVKEKLLPSVGMAQPQASMPRPQKRASLPLRQGPAFLPDTLEDVSEHPPQLSQYHGQLSQKNKNQKPFQKATKNIPEIVVNSEQPPQVPRSLEEQPTPSSYTPPNNVWASLSQWIPPSALFQPSLHAQAFLELSGTQDRSYHDKKDSEEQSHKKEVRHQYARHVQHSKNYRPKTSGPSKQVSTGPLFI